ncbi:MAG: TadE/TadG family type IV pilus assembly protein [Candidatus Limnocylindrales bacterium]
MRLIGRPARRHRRSPGQALVEFTLVIPLFLVIVISIAEFSFLFTSYVSIGYATHDASQMAATLGNTPGADAAILQRIDNDVMVPANPQQIKEVDIYQVDTTSNNGSPMGSRINTWTYDGGSHAQTLPDGSTVYLPFTRTANGYPEGGRCNVNMGVGCTMFGQTTVDTIAVKIVYQYVWITPFPALVGGSTTGPVLSSINVMRLEPVR